MKTQENEQAERKRHLIIIATGIFCAFVVWFFGFRPFLVNGLSMYPNFNASFVDKTKTPLISGDYLIIDIFSYMFLREPKRFDVVVARSPTEPGKHLLKRIIGLPEEKIRLYDNTIEITQQNSRTIILEEPYINRQEKSVYRDQVVTLGKNQYFLLGDNRPHSLDSRVWGGLTKENIVGQVIFRLYPFDTITTYPGEYN